MSETTDNNKKKPNGIRPRSRKVVADFEAQQADAQQAAADEAEAQQAAAEFESSPVVVHQPAPYIPANIYQRLLAVMADCGPVLKTGVAAEGAGGYSFVRHDDVTAHVRSALVAHGVMPVTSVVEATVDSRETTTRRGVSTVFVAKVTVRVRFVNVEVPSDFIEITVPAYSLDTSDKAMGKAVSYAVKYALLKQFMLPSFDDIEDEQIEIISAPATPAAVQREVPKPKAMSPRQELLAVVTEWAKAKPEDGGALAKAYLASLAIPVDGTATDEQVNDALVKAKAASASGIPFSKIMPF